MTALGAHFGSPQTCGNRVAMTTWVAALRIVTEVVTFRVRRLEMANLAGAVAIMLVLRLPWAEVAWRTLFAGLLNVLVYLNNDYHDVALDARTPDKDAAKATFLAGHLREAVIAQWVLLALLAAVAASTSRGLLLVLLAGAGVCWLYSAKLKHTPGLDVLAMAVWGVVMPLSGSPLDRTLGLALAVQLGWFSAVFEALQVIRDHDADRKLSVRTTAVALGVPATLRLARGLMTCAALYAGLVLSPLAAVICVAALALRLRPGQAERFWTQVKLVYGFAWLVCCAFAFASGQSAGLWLQLGGGDTLHALASVR